ncbi:MAG: hypothetical protein HYY58_01415 [Candidatus Omnitrophica bacterium]|nr:hypothetical protein [Candidatus Omnitrophota bacterium]
MRPEIFIERLTHAHRPLIAWWVRRGHRVCVFDFDHCARLRSFGWLRRLLDQGKVETIYVPSSSVADSLAIDTAERFFPAFSSHPLVRAMGRIFGEHEAAPVLKKALVESLFRYFYIKQSLTDRARGASGRQAAIVVSSLYWAWEVRLREVARDVPTPAPTSCPWWARGYDAVARRIQDVLWSLAVCGGILLHAGSIIVGRMLARSQPALQQADHVFAVDSPFQVKFQGPRRADFLLDHQQVTKQNTVFVVHRLGEGPWIQQARCAGYRLIRQAEFADVRHPWRHMRQPPRSVRLGPALRAGGCLAAHPWAAGWLVDAAGRGLVAYLTKSALLERVNFVNYVYMDQDHLSQQCLNILIRKQGGQSWNFAYAIGGGYLYGNGQVPGHRQRRLAYQNPDHFVGTSQRMTRYHQEHRQGVRAYHAVGNLWSQSVSLAASATDIRRLRSAWFGAAADQGRVVAWFDTTFIEGAGSPSTYHEAVAWYRDIWRIVSEDERLLAVIKPSKDDACFVDGRSQLMHPLGQSVIGEWARLKQHPRVHFAGHAIDPSLVIAASDLTVTFCFSSPTAEALGAGKRAMWYEPGERWRDTLYGAEPLLVAHGYPELRRLVGTLLNDMDDEAYRQFLERRVRGLVEDFLDGNGLSRFRELLADAARPAAWSPRA